MAETTKKKDKDQQFICLTTPWTDSRPAGTLANHKEALERDFPNITFIEDVDSGQVKGQVDGKDVAVLTPVAAK